MITLYGFGISNYFNKVKLALLEKGIAFHEERVAPSQDASLLKKSPLGKIPYIDTPQGALSESQAIVEYLEDAYPENPLYPADPYARAKCRELILHLELNVEQVARRLYTEAFFGGSLPDDAKADVKTRLEAGLQGFSRLAAFSPYVFSDRFTLADCAAWPHLTLIGKAAVAIYGEDLIAAHLPAVADYLKLIESRPAAQSVAKDRAQALQLFYAARKP
ncbi:glutathione S-transferase family protein [Methylococcus sp. EFPC2]|uniref:glutathione S-transferase family protein n=1 Tax=Methylococcus sp. EFPC2 TaxID=2812648 RepID=UPI00196704F9|nr:glutathione S-transferase [Methylococcus sp. EFPC2]QSA97555.1 glutathione S-transferase [Methylococcus sp. EFPC2]